MIVAFIVTICFLPALLVLLRPGPEPRPVQTASLAAVDRWIEEHRPFVLVVDRVIVLGGLPALMKLRVRLQSDGSAQPQGRERLDLPRSCARPANRAEHDFDSRAVGRVRRAARGTPRRSARGRARRVAQLLRAGRPGRKARGNPQGGADAGACARRAKGAAAERYGESAGARRRAGHARDRRGSGRAGADDPLLARGGRPREGVACGARSGAECDLRQFRRADFETAALARPAQGHAIRHSRLHHAAIGSQRTGARGSKCFRAETPTTTG